MKKLRKPPAIPRAFPKGQTALEYLMIISGVTLLVLLVLVAVKAIIDSGAINAKSLVDAYGGIVKGIVG